MSGSRTFVAGSGRSYTSTQQPQKQRKGFMTVGSVSGEIHREPKRKLSKRRSSWAFQTVPKATKRVIAPYVNIVRKGQQATLKHIKDNEFYQFYLQKKPNVLQRNLTQFLDDTADLSSLLTESLETLKVVTNAAGGRLYFVDLSANEIYLNEKYTERSRRRVSWKIEKHNTVAGHVAATRECILLLDVIADPNFPGGIPYVDLRIKSVLAVPVNIIGDECFAVIELYRDILQPPFQTSDLKTTTCMSNWIGAAIFMNQQKIGAMRKYRLDDCLIQLTKCYMADTVLFDKMISEIVRFAKTCVSAERASFFVLDTNEDSLVADVFDEGTKGNKEYTSKRSKVVLSKERGIAGEVIRTGIGLNIRDAYKDSRFSKEMDDQTGFITRSILCMPVIGLYGVLGVVQAINKVNGSCFSKADEYIFKTFCVYCSLALHYSRAVKSRIKDQERYQITVSLLKRHGLLPCRHDVDTLIANRDFHFDADAIREFTWYIPGAYVEEMPKIAMYMIVDICGDAMDINELARFVLATKNFYRNNAYHNWEHGFTVCHCMYNILIRDPDLFTDIEKKGLIIATLAHDVDHGGVTNQFLYLDNDPLSQLYDSAPWENHHYYVTMLMLEEMHIFKDISAEEFREVNQVIKDAILATDLANYFKIRVKLITELDANTLDWDDKFHRYMIHCVIMNVCDLSGQCKPFPIAKRVTDVLYREFYMQGDKEREMGGNVLSLFDRYQPNKIPQDQVQFLNVLVLPICDLVRKCLPNAEVLYRLAERLRDIWKDALEIQNERCWKQEDSMVPEKRNKYST